MALNGEMTEEERKHVATLESARAEWQRNLAQRITAATASKTQSPSWWRRQLTIPRLAFAGACVLAMVGVTSWVLVERNQPATAERYLAQAYTEKRTLELRMAGADYAPVRVSRGATASFTSRPEPLLKAEALISGKLEAHPADPAWLQAEAKADILEGRYDGAVEALHRAIELSPHTPALLIDLATAHFQRALEGDRKQDFGAAFEYLSQALNISPDDQVALFNRAIVSEHQFLYRQALDDWDHYLRLDRKSQWADEARNRAKAVREILKEHGKVMPLLSPAQIAARANDASLAAEVDLRVEEYLNAAVRTWLPAAFPVPQRKSKGKEDKPAADRSATQALFFLADLTRQKHEDQWLSDLLRGSSQPRFLEAVNALGAALRANDASDFDTSVQQSKLAERHFRASGNIAGVVRAQFEQAFSAQFERRTSECRRQAKAVLTESARYSYPWVQIQAVLEDSVCAAISGDYGTYEKGAQRAVNRAQFANYDGTYLRALGFLMEGKGELGDHKEVAGLIQAGLKRYWSGQFSPMAGYDIYTLAADGIEANQSYLLLAVRHEAAAAVDADEDFLFRAEAHSSVASAAIAAYRSDEGMREYEEAARLYALAPQTDATKANRLLSEIWAARAETNRGASNAAFDRLSRVQEEVQQLSSNFLLQAFYATLGEVQIRSHRAVDAERDFRPAVDLTERSLASLNSEKSRTIWSKNAAPVYLGLTEAELVQGREQESLDLFEWYLNAPRRAGTRHSVKAVSLTPSRLSPRPFLLFNQTLLALAVLPNGLAVWVYDDRGVNAKWIPKSPAELQDLQDLAGNFEAQCSDPNSAMIALRRDSRMLYAVLIAPVEQYLSPGRTLLIETDGWLARVPFEALLDSQGRYLIERASIVHSLGRDSQTRPHDVTQISPASPALVMASGASASADGLIPLPDVGAEASTVASGFRSAYILKGGKATLDAFRNKIARVAVFHFAGHSIVSPDRTGLMLETGDESNGPSVIDADLVRQLHPQNLQLAVLSSCSTALGSGGSSGFDSITDAFLRAGVPHVVASRWSVDSAETREFVQDFYRNALSGQTVSDAIRLSSRKILADARTSHPYYWSAFAAYGRP
jgi:CHAT domain-containing protein